MKSLPACSSAHQLWMAAAANLDMAASTSAATGCWPAVMGDPDVSVQHYTADRTHVRSQSSTTQQKGHMFAASHKYHPSHATAADPLKQSCGHLQVFQSCALVRDTVGLSNSGISSAVAKVCLPLVVACVKTSITLPKCSSKFTAGHAQKAGDLWDPSDGLKHLRAAVGWQARTCMDCSRLTLQGDTLHKNT